MKLILTAEVTGLGAPGDIVEVKDGYGRNYLLPRGLAIVATRGAEKQVDDDPAGPRGPRGPRPRARPARSQPELGGADRHASRPRAGDGGRLFGSVTAADVVDAVRGRRRPGARPPRRSSCPAASRPSAQHTVTVRLHPEVTTELDVAVVAG